MSIKTKVCMWLHKKSGEEMNLHRLTFAEQPDAHY